ncbi:uncharacterized protein LOC123270556 isoform X1 [Cotesia glomerata]|uniref:BEN domain-containing protein n=1 Tax=Cotesia glomerata TaxID=32391 RepID=A0AAV7IHP0_COTGL|nr:uncharacterized protein LOC123270556 isoform X1 [Cotesia glomerata]KAH0551926.1 hypothetical protein KQX54_003096 [Cotesia glomerata]
MNKGYALIYWVNSKNTETVKLSTIPKKCRQNGAVIALKWKNTVTGASEKKVAKILKIAKDKHELNNLTVDTSTGILLEKPTQSTHPSLIISRSDLLYAAKKAAKIKIAKQKDFDSNKSQKNKNYTSAVFTALSDDDTSSSDSSDDDSQSDNEDNRQCEEDDVTEQVKNLLQSATVENLNFLKRLIGVMEKVCHQRVPVKQEKEPSVQEIINQEKENIHSSLGSFLPPMTINAISHRNPDLSDWKKLTTDILVEIYGKELAFLSAKGRRGARGIDPNVYRSVYDLINMRLGWILPSKEFVRHVNKVCSNRKKYARKPPAGTSTSQEVVSEEDPIATLEQGDFDHHHEIQYPDSNFCTIQISETYSQAQM